MRSIARVRWRKNAEHLPRVEQEAWRRENEQEREAEKHRQGQSEQAFEQSEEGDWWTVLEVSPDAGMAEIRDAYRHKVRQCHPDHMSAVAPEFLELAERRTKALNAAYSQAMRAMPAPQRVHPFQRLWPPIMIAVMFLIEGAWIVFLVYLSVKFIRSYF
jgi:DnaJ domain